MSGPLLWSDLQGVQGKPGFYASGWGRLCDSGGAMTIPDYFCSAVRSRFP
jgi:hypothetical protein